MHEVMLDPQFHDLLKRYELAVRRFRQAVADLRLFYFNHKLSPSEESASEKWRGALLQNAVNLAQVDLETALGHLGRYGFGLTPHSDSPAHLASLDYERQSQQKRVYGRGWYSRNSQPEGTEVELIDPEGGPPITVILKDPLR